MNFIIDLLSGVIILALCYIILVIIVKLPELAEQKSKIGSRAKKITKIFNYALVVYLAISVVAGLIGVIILFFH